jgi:hypothetical protein
MWKELTTDMRSHKQDNFVHSRDYRYLHGLVTELLRAEHAATGSIFP